MVDCFILDWGEVIETFLSAAPVVAVIDRGDDRDGEFFSCGPGFRVENIALSSEKNDSIAAFSPAAATLPIDPARW